jgi:hypothetical protein
LAALRIGPALLVGLTVFVAPPSGAYAGAGETCRDQAAIAERAAGIPEGLLLAIGKRESGLYDPQYGAALPWPWAVNREGEDRYLATRDEAIAFVAAAQRAGSRSIDVGCFQVNLKYHPMAFASLEEAFDPAFNAAYAARFLATLYARAQSWEAAVANYHSATPWHGVPYREAVFATWRGLTSSFSTLARPAWSMARSAMGIRIWVPGGTVAPYALAPFAGRLPRVITPSMAAARGRS